MKMIDYVFVYRNYNITKTYPRSDHPLNTQSDEQERDLAGILEEFRRKANESSTENTEDEFENQVNITV